MKKTFYLPLVFLVLVPVFAKPKYTFSCERHEVPLGKKTTVRRYITIARNGESRGIWIPSYEEVRNLEEPVFDETDDGFSLSFHWGGGRYFWYEVFFFKKIAGEPCLYKIDSTVYELTYNRETGEFDEETETQTRPIEPPIKISELNADKINGLLGGGGE